MFGFNVLVLAAVILVVSLRSLLYCVFWIVVLLLVLFCCVAFATVASLSVGACCVFWFVSVGVLVGWLLVGLANPLVLVLRSLNFSVS